MTEQKKVPDRYIVIHRFAWGPFANAAEAHAFAEKNWPDLNVPVQFLRDPAATVSRTIRREGNR